MATSKKTDLSAALTGFVLGAVSLFLLLTAIVLLTNAHYRNKEAGEPAHQTAGATPSMSRPGPGTSMSSLRRAS